MNPHQVTRDFEKALCIYTGAPFAVAVNSCTSALLLAVAWHLYPGPLLTIDEYGSPNFLRETVEIPKRTYVSVPMAIIHAGGRPTFRDDVWEAFYQLSPLPVWDCARWFTSGMFNNITAGEVKWRDRPSKLGKMQCVSFHTSKILADTQGGAILHDDPEADAWLRRARFDGRTEGVAPKDDTFDTPSWHCYMSPDVAARLLWKLSILPKYNEPLPNDEYPDLSLHKAFQ